MEILTFVLVLVFLFIFLSKNGRVKELEIKINRLEKRIKCLENPIELTTDVGTCNTSIKDVPINLTKEVISTKSINSTKQKKTKIDKESLLNRFLENGSGTIGVLLLVIGMAFLGVYSALTMTAFPRFLLFILFSLTFLVARISLKKK